MRLDWYSANPPYLVGLDRGVLYAPDGRGMVWNGLLSVTDTKTVESTKIFLDGQVIRVFNRPGQLSGSIVAYTYPDILDNWYGKAIGVAYRVNTNSGYQIHVLYGVKIRPDDRAFSAIGSEISPGGISWQMSATTHLIISSDQAAIGAIEDALYGSDATDATLPTLEDLYSIVDAEATLRITDHGDGTWTADGPDGVVNDNGDGTFTINAPSLTYLDDVTYHVSSY